MKTQNKTSLPLNILTLILLTAVIFSFSLCVYAARAYDNSVNALFKDEIITATISFDRKQNMQNGNMQEMPSFGDDRGNGMGEKPEDDKMPMPDVDGEMPSIPENGFDGGFSLTTLTLADYVKYASSQYVKDFYYTATAYLNGYDILPIGSDDSSTDGEISGSITEDNDQQDPSIDQFLSISDFSLVGYSKQTTARENITLESGTFFCEGTVAYECIISRSLANENNLSLGDKITFCDINDEDQKYTLTVCGIYSAVNSDTTTSFDIFDQTSENSVYLNAETVADIAGENVAINAVYSFDNINSYISFRSDVYTLGLDSSYSVSSNEADTTLDSLSSLETVSSVTKKLLIPITAVGAVIVIAFAVILTLKLKKHTEKKYSAVFVLVKNIALILAISLILSAACFAIASNKILTSIMNPSSQQPADPSQNNGGFGDRPGNMPDKSDMPEMPDMSDKSDMPSMPDDKPNATPNAPGGDFEVPGNGMSNIEIGSDPFVYVTSAIYAVALLLVSGITSFACVSLCKKEKLS